MGKKSQGCIKGNPALGANQRNWSIEKNGYKSTNGKCATSRPESSNTGKRGQKARTQRKPLIMRREEFQYIHISYEPEVGWVLSIMSRLMNSSNPQLKAAFERWSETPLKELGFAITTRMQMLPLAINRLSASVAEIRRELKSDNEQPQFCLSKNGAFRLKNRGLAY